MSVCKYPLLVLLLGLISSFSWGQNSEPFLLVSDVDDTFKISNMPHKMAAFKNAIFSKKSFAGMSELYQEMAKNSVSSGGPERPLYVLTGGPFLWKPRIKALLRYNGYPIPQKIKTRNILKEKTYDYKFRVLSQLVESSKYPLILVGDDTEVDPQIFGSIQAKFPQQVLKVYIRQNLAKPNAEGISPFYTAFDMALEEMRARRLSAEQVVIVGKAILAETNPSLIFPSFASCPSTFETSSEQSSLAEVINQLSAKLKLICRRGSGSKH